MAVTTSQHHERNGHQMEDYTMNRELLGFESFPYSFKLLFRWRK